MHPHCCGCGIVPPVHGQRSLIDAVQMPGLPRLRPIAAAAAAAPDGGPAGRRALCYGDNLHPGHTCKGLACRHS